MNVQVLTCDQYTAEAQEGELTDGLKVKLHAGDKLSIDTEPLSHMLLLYSHAPPPELGFPNQEIPHGTIPRKYRDTGIRMQGSGSLGLSEKT